MESEAGCGEVGGGAGSAFAGSIGGGVGCEHHGHAAVAFHFRLAEDADGSVGLRKGELYAVDDESACIAFDHCGMMPRTVEAIAGNGEPEQGTGMEGKPAEVLRDHGHHTGR